MNIEQVAKEALLEISPATECIADAVEATEFLRRCLAKLAAQAIEPSGYWYSDDPAVCAYPGSGYFPGEVPPNDAINIVPLFSEASLAAAQQRTAEACAKVHDAQIERMRQQLAEVQQEIVDRKADCEACHDQDEATIESLREQLSVAASEILSLRKANKECVEYFNEAQKDLAEKDAEIDRLTSVISSYKTLTAAQENQLCALNGRLYALRGADKTLDSEREANALLTEQLAASQLREQQLREALEVVNNTGDDEWYPYTPEQAKKTISEALALPQDTSALEAMIQKAGEVMRDRVFNEVRAHYLWTSADKAHETIRALPPVTLEDLK